MTPLILDARRLYDSNLTPKDLVAIHVGGGKVHVRIPQPLLFLMVSRVIPGNYGKEEVSLHAFTNAGLYSRTLGRYPGRPWDWLRDYETREPLPWLRVPGGAYEGHEPPTPEGARAWHEREHGWRVVETTPVLE